ncbi:MAG: hypothetical protein WCK34_00510 [Bacteroidota bacterium]
MKKTLAILSGVCVVLFLAFTLMSCSKTYTCSCPYGLSVTVKALTKAAAKSACEKEGCTL